MSDLPVWVGAAGAVGQAVAASGQLYLGVRAARQEAAAEFGRLLAEMLDLPAEAIAELLGHDRLAELVGYAWEAAARTASEEKRWVLARIAAAGLRAEVDDAEVDPLPLLLRTVEALDGPHIRLLVLIATPRPGTGQLVGTALEGFLAVEDLEEGWPGAAGLVKPMLAVLERENLVEDRAVGTWDYRPAYGITAYGRRFLRYLPGEPPELQQAHLTVAMPSTTEITIRNVGLAVAEAVTVPEPKGVDAVSMYMGGKRPEPFDLPPGEDLRIPVRAPTPSHPLPYRLTITWRDGRGESSQTFTVGKSRDQA